MSAAGGEVTTARWLLRGVGAQGGVDVDRPGGQRLDRAVVGARHSWLPGKRLDRPGTNKAFSIGRAISTTHVMSEHKRRPHVSGIGRRRPSETASVRVRRFRPVRHRLTSVALHQEMKSDGAPIRSTAPSRAETVAVAMGAVMRIGSMGWRWSPNSNFWEIKIHLSRQNHESSVARPRVARGPAAGGSFCSWGGYPAQLRGLGSAPWAAKSTLFLL